MWRLRTATDAADLKARGAAEEINDFLGDKPSFEIFILSGDIADGKLTLLTRDGSKAVISVLGSFAIDFYSASGVKVQTIKDITKNGDGDYVITSALAANEAVYGSGERLNSLNLRTSKKVELYSSDGYNNSNATYVPVPLFVTTKGGAIFVNRYERMVATLSAMESAGTLQIVLENEFSDLYVFATTKMTDAIANYTDLTGHADVPEEWNDGVIVTRYSPDLTVLKTDYPYEEFVSGQAGGIVNMLQRYAEMGTLPAAFCTEGWGRDIFSTGSDTRVIADRDAQGNLQFNDPDTKFDLKVKTVTGPRYEVRGQELVDICEYLHLHGIKFMLYTRAGDVPTTDTKTTAHGITPFKASYQVEANVTDTNGTANVTKIPRTASGTNPDAGTSSAGWTYLDITNAEAWEWYIKCWKALVEAGVDGVKIDFCEELPDEGYNYNGTIVNRYYWADRTVFEPGTEHHAYASLYVSKFYRDISKISKDLGKDGFMVLTRGGGIGAQRSPYMWAGDQVRQWDKLDDQIKAVMSCGLSGIPFMTYDMGGYHYGSINGVSYSVSKKPPVAQEEAIFIRALEMGTFIPCMQTHGDVRNAFEFSDGARTIFNTYLAFREKLHPYIDKYNAIAAKTGTPAVRHLVLCFQDDVNTYNVEDEFMLGDSLLVAPILSQNAEQRTVYLPEGCSWKNMLTGTTYTGGQSITVVARNGEIAVFEKVGCSAEDQAMLDAAFESTEWALIKSNFAK